MQISKSDFLVVGSGIAGLSFALEAAEKGSVILITKKDNTESSTNLAQGGIASVLGKTDSIDLHVADTLKAGADLCNEVAVRILVENGPVQIDRLIQLGVRFSRERRKDGSAPLALGREGGHTTRRIVHSADLTGKEIERALVAAALARDRILVYEDHMAVDLIITGEGKSRRCAGVIALDIRAGEVEIFLAREVFLCTGGLGKIYLHTTNPEIATGDGVAMGYRAGAEINNMEFIQFHPTALFHENADSFLISEALRGEGGELFTGAGDRFMPGYHDDAELAPRDIVARAIDAELKKTGEQCVYLSITHLSKSRIMERFPTIYEKCLNLGINIAQEPIPVIPAAHYQCGGIKTDLDAHTTIPGLFAAGEVACTGVHGANRLASNSLLEAVVFSHKAVQALGTEPASSVPDSIATENTPGYVYTEASDPVLRHFRREIRDIMWHFAGIIRTGKHLSYATRRLNLIMEEVDEIFKEGKLSADLIQTRNMACTAYLVTRCAAWRKESRGLHFLTEHPEKDNRHWKKNTRIILGAAIK